MDFKTLENKLLSKKDAVKEFPFGPDVAVFKVSGKMFALAAWEERPLRLTLKARPEDALVQRSMFPAVQPGYHMNKEHWNTITLDGSLAQDILFKMIDESYQLVVSKLPMSKWP